MTEVGICVLICGYSGNHGQWWIGVGHIWSCVVGPLVFRLQQYL